MRVCRITRLRHLTRDAGIADHMHALVDGRLESSLIDRAPAGLIGQPCAASDATGLLSRNHVGYVGLELLDLAAASYPAMLFQRKSIPGDTTSLS